MSASTRNSCGPPAPATRSRPLPAGGADAGGDGVGRCGLGRVFCALAGITAAAPAPAATPSAAPMKLRRPAARPSMLDSRPEAALSLLLLIFETPRDFAW